MARPTLKKKVTEEDIKKFRKILRSPGGQKVAFALAEALEYLPDGEFEESSKPLDEPLCPVGDFIESVKANPEQYRIDAKLFEFNPRLHKGRVRPCRDTAEFLERVQEAERTSGQARKLMEGGFLEDSFEVGDPIGGSITGNKVGTEFIQLLGGPFSKQLYYYDYLLMHAQAFEARNHNPIAKFIVNMLTDFTLGRGLTITVQDGDGQKVIDEFWERNKMNKRLRTWSDELSIYGEIMTRKFVQNGKTTVRGIDPSTVWEIVTEPDDLEQIYYYHQQYPTRYLLYLGTPQNAPQLPKPAKMSDYIIRQIPGDQVWHTKINCVSNEARGRSELFAALGWMKRLKDYLTYKVIKAKNEAAFVWDVTVQGSQADVNAYAGLGYSDPQAGSERVHNEAIKFEPMVGSSGRSTRDEVADWLISMIAMAVGIPTEYLGLLVSAGSSNRAGAIVGTEPIAKKVQTRQLIFEDMVQDICNAVLINAGIKADPAVEITFPEIIVADRSKKIDDLIKCQGMKWIAKETAATIAGKEMAITSYDYKEEQEKVATETSEEQAVSGIQLFPENPAKPSGNGQPPAASPTSAPGRGEDMTGVGKNRIKDQHKRL